MGRYCVTWSKNTNQLLRMWHIPSWGHFILRLNYHGSKVSRSIIASKERWSYGVIWLVNWIVFLQLCYMLFKICLIIIMKQNENLALIWSWKLFISEIAGPSKLKLWQYGLTSLILFTTLESSDEFWSLVLCERPLKQKSPAQRIKFFKLIWCKTSCHNSW